MLVPVGCHGTKKTGCDVRSLVRSDVHDARLVPEAGCWSNRQPVRKEDKTVCQNTVRATLVCSASCSPEVVALFEEHVRGIGSSVKALEKHGADLLLAFLCSRHERTALRVLDRDLLPDAQRVVTRISRCPAFIDEVLQGLRERLLMPPKPLILRYSAKGTLRAWLRTSALRSALNLRKAEARWLRRSTVDFGQEASEPVIDVEFGAVQRAFNDAVAALVQEKRVVIRSYYLEGHSIDAIGRAYGVNRATIYRWITRSQRELYAHVVEKVQRALSLSLEEARREVAAVYHCLDASEF